LSARTLLATWAIATPLYLGALLYLAQDFLPVADQAVYDCRWMVCSNYDKLDEFAFVEGAELDRLSELVRIQLLGEPFPEHEVNFNPAPVLLVKAVSLILPPVVAYNVTVLLSWLGAGLAMAALVLGLTRVPAAGLLAGWLYLLAPATLYIQHCRSLDYGLLLLLPLILGLALRVGGSGGWPSAAGLAVALVLSWCTNQYYALGMSGFCLAWTVPVLLTRDGGRSIRVRSWGAFRLVAALALSLVVVAPWLWIEATALGARQDDMATYGVGTIETARVVGQLGGWVDPRRIWTLPVLALALVGAVVSTPAMGARARGLGAVAAAGIAACGLGLLLYVPLSEFLRDSSVTWRMREIHLLSIIPATVVVALAGTGWAGIAARLRSTALAIGLLLLSTLLCAGILVDGAGWWPGVREEGTSLQVPESVVGAVAAIQPSPTLFVVAADGDPEIASALQVVVAQRTEVQRLHPTADALVQDLFAGDEPPAAPGIPDDLSRSCVVALVRGTGPPRAEALDTLATLGLSAPAFADGDWVLVQNSRCGMPPHRGQEIGPSDAP